MFLQKENLCNELYETLPWNDEFHLQRDVAFALQIAQKSKYFSFGWGEISYKLFINVKYIDVAFFLL